ncbi:MAG: LamG domain-containing protein, partial [bacterium]|nr:LamG domain-containing protein [bacterium]
MGRLSTAMLLVLTVLRLCQAAPSGRVLILTFEGQSADRNDYAQIEPLDPRAWRVTEMGTGCPAYPAGRAFDAGHTDPSGIPVLILPLPHDADLRQGTVEFWFRPGWNMGERRIRTLMDIKLRGGYWHGIWLGYHGTIGADTESFGMNIMDGVDHPAYVPDARHRLGWKAGEWHHLAATWTGHAVYVFADGNLVAQVFSDLPLRIRENEGQLRIGGGWGDLAPSAGGLIDEFRLVNLPLYSPTNPPDPKRRVTEPLPLGKAWLGAGAKATADSTAEPHQPLQPAPALNNGQYGDGVIVPDVIVLALPEERVVSAFEWSYDGTPYAGEGGRGWAPALP